MTEPQQKRTLTAEEFAVEWKSLKEREKWVTEAKAYIEQREEREAIQRDQPDRFYRWNHE